MSMGNRWTVALGSALLLAAGSLQAYEVDKKTSQIVIKSVDDFDLCIKDLGSSPACLDGLVKYAEKRPRDALAAGKRARLQYNSYAALPLFDIALGKKPDAAVCSDEDLQISLRSALSLPPSPLLNRALEIGFTKCFEQVKEGLVKEVDEDPVSYYRANTCPLFTVKGLSLPGCQPKVAEVKEDTGPSPEIANLKGIQWRSLKLDQPSAIALRGAEDEQVLLVKVRGQENLFVVKFKNIRGPFNNQVFVARERPGGTGRDYVALIEGDEWVLISRRPTQPAGMYQTFPKSYDGGLKVYRGALVDQGGPGSTSEIVGEFK